MKNSKGSDQAILFYNRTVELLLRQTTVIRKSFTKGITIEERGIIINALEDLRYYPKNSDTSAHSVYMVKKVIYEGTNNKITIYANPAYFTRPRDTRVNWQYKAYQSV